MKANLDKNLAPAWVSGKSYSTGEFCLYNKRLYICTTDNSDAEFDNSKWERRNLVDLVSGGNSNLSNGYTLVDYKTAHGTSQQTETISFSTNYNSLLLVIMGVSTNFSLAVNLASGTHDSLYEVDNESWYSAVMNVRIYKLNTVKSGDSITIKSNHFNAFVLK